MEHLKKNDIVFGIFVVVFASAFLFFFPIRVIKELPIPAMVTAVTSPIPEELDRAMPNTLVIPRLGITTAIQPGAYNQKTGAWDLSWNVAQFATMTVAPNTAGGKTLLYAHNTRRLFGPTAKIRLGDEAIVTTADGKTFRYIYAQDRVVDPADTSILQNAQDGPPQLVLLTCTGIVNQHRRLLFFTIEK